MRFLVKAVLIIATLVFIVLLATWLVIARPGFGSDSSLEALQVSVSADRLRQHVEFLASPDRPRDYSHPENLNAAANYIAEQFMQFNVQVTRQSYQVDGVVYQNVIAQFGDAKAEQTVIGAHYDVAGELPGADDNASGVAGLIELGRLFANHPPKTAVQLVFYTLEEPPFFRSEHMGSAVHAQSMVRAGIPVRLMISLEMIGYYCDQPGCQSYPVGLLEAVYPDTGDFIAVVGQLGSNEPARLREYLRDHASVDSESINAPALLQGIDFSDHRSYWAHDIDAIMVTDTAFFRNRAYHTDQDTPERLDYAKMARLIEGIFGYTAS